MTKQDLENLKKFKKIEPLLTYTEEYIKESKINDFINGTEETKSLLEQYNELHPETKVETIKTAGGTIKKEIEIPYIKYSETKIEITEDGEKEVPVIPEEYIEDGEIKEEYKDYQIAPTFELFKNQKLDEFLETLEITDEEIKELAKPYFIEIVSILADETHEKAEAKIAEVENISEKQIQRYKLKAELAQKAKDGDVDAKAKLQTEADLTGINVDTLIELILELSEKYNKEVDDYISLIEAFRVAVKAKYETDFRAAVKVAIEAKKLGTDTTPEKLQELFNKYFG